MNDKLEDKSINLKSELGDFFKLNINNEKSSFFINRLGKNIKITLLNKYNINIIKYIENILIENNIVFFPYIYNLSYEGNGEIIFYTDKKFYVQKFKNFTKISEKETFFSNNDIAEKLEKKSLYINKDNKGLLFCYKDIDINNNFKYPYIKKINNFIVEDKDIKLIDSNKYKYHDYSINKNGNGIIILTDGEHFILKKIRNYEVEN
ncbi:MAG: hypothetical protein U0457_11540 [Candidatus Sericytochromatia bacterium]